MFSLPDACRRLKTSLLLSQTPTQARQASIDTRTLREGDLFVALPGIHTDGHRFVKEAFRKGAAGALVRKAVIENDPDQYLESAGARNLIPVEDVLRALQELCVWYRSGLRLPVAGITGSVGKTSAKEFLFYLLSRKFTGIRNPGNFNNEIGVPLTVLSLQEGDRFAVCEMGASRLGDIAALARLCRPSLGVLTGISTAHLESFGSLENIYETKFELLRELPKGSVIVLPDDPEILRKAEGYDLHRIIVGTSEGADYRLSDVCTDGAHVLFRVNGRPYRFAGQAAFLALNAALAVAGAEAMGIKPGDIPEVWDGVCFQKGRFEISRLAGEITAVNDAYNASPLSFRAALETFCRMPLAGRRVLVFADMLELGTESAALHEELGNTLSQFPLECILCFGSEARHSFERYREKVPGREAHYFQNGEEIPSFLEHYLKPGDGLLLKGSRSMHVDAVLETLRAKLQTDCCER